MTLVPLIWLIVAVVLALVEIFTMGLVTIWFAVGAVFAMIAALLDLNEVLQIGIFLLVSTTMLIFTRPFIKGKFQVKKEKTNADRLIGKKADVIETIDNTRGTGSVKVQGQIWSARAFDDVEICQGEEVEVVEITGVKLTVKRI